MKRLKSIAQKLFFSDDLPFTAKMNNFMCVCGIIGALFLALIYLITDSNKTIVILILGLCSMVALAVTVANIFDIHRIAIIVDLCFLADVFFPLIFIFGGGISGPALIYFVLSITLIFLLTKGRKLAILLGSHLFVIFVCFYIAVEHPDTIVTLGQRQRVINNLSAVVVSGFLLGAIVLFQYSMYSRAQNKIIESNSMLAKQSQILRELNDADSTLMVATNDEFNIELGNNIGIIAKGIGADSATIWKKENINGVKTYVKINDWHFSEIHNVFQKDVKIEIAGDDFSSALDAALENGECINWSSQVLQGKVIEGIFSSTKASLVIPELLLDDLWGAVGFHRIQDDSYFTSDEIELARAGSLILINAYQRNSMMQDVVEAKEKAVSGTRAKTDFLSNMSHEMRTPMNAIIGMTAIGKNSDSTERKEYCLTKIEEASTHLLGLINDILDMSKIEANKFELSKSEFNFERTIQKAANVTKYKVDEKEQRFNVQLDKDIPPILFGDDQRILQVLTNLLSNAVKFTPERGNISLEASLLKRVDDNCTLQVKVKDSGIGISEEQQARLFSSFQQADSSTSRKFGGTGLGLVISKTIIEMMNGRIWIESELGKGASFIFEIDVEVGGQELKRLLAGDSNWKNVSIMIVDDDSMTRDVLSDMAKSLEIKCVTAGSGKEACALLEKDNYDIFFVDWKMPEMDGLELTRRIKAKEGRPSVVIMISANQWQNIESDAKEAGVDMFLSKPLFSSDVVDCINTCLGVAKGEKKHDTFETIDCFEGHCILLAEDVEINQEIVLALLEDTKLEVICANNGKEAVDMFVKNPSKYELILMDIQMPEMDGLEATRQIKALSLPEAKDISIIAMTANVFKDDVEKCLAAGMIGHMGKPLNYEELMGTLRNHLLHSNSSK